ncbi:hypothetical protein COU74_01095 [Candidatus Peregrinibacteria bacterium CG10_big_fil_rev_8_21_14_0_10_36_19]|nr:MAG: hypothetical protein COU74_01095 [Candidatus Peregrinibacteria bacterium CG10_big_fil_rev_8_21_14_0_10_36_19]
MSKKTLKTIKETPKGKNVKSIDLRNLTKKENTELVKKADKGQLPGYHIVKQKGKAKFLRSNPDVKKKNNLDPKINS